MSLRQKIWNKLAVEWRPDRVHDQVRTIDFDELPTHFDAYLKGMVRGRTVVRIGAGHASLVVAAPLRAAPLRRRVGARIATRPACPHPGGGKAFPRGTRGRPRNGVNDTRRSPMPTYKEFHRRSLADRDAFWREQAALIDWQTPFTPVLDYSTAAVRASGSSAAAPTSATTRSTATWRRAPDADGADLHLDRDRPGEAATRSASCTPRCNRFAAILKAQGVAAATACSSTCR